MREVAESKGDLEIVHPPVSIIAEPYVAWVDANVARHKTEALAKAYLEYLFTDRGAGDNREARLPAGQRGDSGTKIPPGCPKLDLFPITAIARDWDDANQKFFADNGVMDTVLPPATH